MKRILFLGLLLNTIGCGPHEAGFNNSDSKAYDYADNAGFEGGPLAIAPPMPVVPAIPAIPAIPVPGIPVAVEAVPVPVLPALPPPLGAEFLPLGNTPPWQANYINSYGQLPSRVATGGPFLYSYAVKPRR